MDHISPPRLRALLDSVLLVASDLDLSGVLDRIVQAAAELVDARYAALGVLDETGTQLADFLTVGLSDEQKRAIGDLPRGHGVLGMLIMDPKPLRLPNLVAHPDSYGFPPNHPPMTSFLGVPIRLRNRVFGNLYLTDKKSAEVFSDADEEVVVFLAAAAAVAIENARLHARVEAMAVIEDRERIARDLHDTVIQRIFAAGLALQATAQLATEPVSSRIAATVDQLDAIVKEVRSVIFQLEEPKIVAGLSTAVSGVVNEVSRLLGFAPTLVIQDEFHDLALDADVRHALLATLREAMSNIVRHANATAASVSITVEDSDVVLTVTDDGVGIGMAATSGQVGKGLENARDRALKLGGSLTVAEGFGGGTELQWRVSAKRS